MTSFTAVSTPARVAGTAGKMMPAVHADLRDLRAHSATGVPEVSRFVVGRDVVDSSAALALAAAACACDQRQQDRSPGQQQACRFGPGLDAGSRVSRAEAVGSCSLQAGASARGGVQRRWLFGGSVQQGYRFGGDLASSADGVAAGASFSGSLPSGAEQGQRFERGFILGSSQETSVSVQSFGSGVIIGETTTTGTRFTGARTYGEQEEEAPATQEQCIPGGCASPCLKPPQCDNWAYGKPVEPNPGCSIICRRSLRLASQSGDRFDFVQVC